MHYDVSQYHVYDFRKVSPWSAGTAMVQQRNPLVRSADFLRENPQSIQVLVGSTFIASDSFPPLRPTLCCVPSWS
jgi:hypothetical protein